MKTISTKASADVLNELQGRMYECVDICAALEAGTFSSLDQLRQHLKAQSARLDRTIRRATETGVLQLSENSCVVLLD